MSTTLTILCYMYTSFSMVSDPLLNSGSFSNVENVFVTNSQFTEVTGFKHYGVC